MDPRQKHELVFPRGEHSMSIFPGLLTGRENWHRRCYYTLQVVVDDSLEECLSFVSQMLLKVIQRGVAGSLGSSFVVYLKCCANKKERRVEQKRKRKFGDYLNLPGNYSPGVNSADENCSCDNLHEKVLKPWKLITEKKDFEFFCEKVILSFLGDKMNGKSMKAISWNIVDSVTGVFEFDFKKMKMLSTKGLEKLLRINEKITSLLQFRKLDVKCGDDSLQQFAENKAVCFNKTICYNSLCNEAVLYCDVYRGTFFSGSGDVLLQDMQEMELINFLRKYFDFFPEIKSLVFISDGTNTSKKSYEKEFEFMQRIFAISHAFCLEIEYRVNVLFDEGQWVDFYTKSLKQWVKRKSIFEITMDLGDISSVHGGNSFIMMKKRTSKRQIFPTDDFDWKDFKRRHLFCCAL